MTILYGTLVGTPKQTSPFSPVDSAYERTFDEILVRDTVTLNAAAIGTQVEAIQNLGWETVLDPASKLFWGAMGAGVTLGFGGPVHPVALDAAIDVSAAGSANLMSAINIGNYYLPLWQNLGYASLAAAQLVAQQATLYFTTAGAVTAGNNRSLTWKLVGSRRL